MRYGRKFQHGMEMEWKKIASKEYGKIVFHSISFHTMPCGQHKSKKIAYEVTLPVFCFTLNTISCFLLSRYMEAESGSG